MFASIISTLQNLLRPFFVWCYNEGNKVVDIIQRFSHGWAWFLAAIIIVMGMTIDALDMVLKVLDYMLLFITGFDIGSKTELGSFNQIWNLANAIFPVHECLSCIIILMPLYLAINLVRIFKAVVSMVPILYGGG